MPNHYCRRPATGPVIRPTARRYDQSALKRAIVIVLDGCGAGAAPDAAAFNDGPSVNTLANVWNHAKGIDAPNLVQAGLFAAAGVGPTPQARFGRLRELSQGKDSVTGHWEMMGVVTQTPFPTYPGGFPPALIQAFEERTGTKAIGNKPASGTAVIAELGEEHMRTRNPIVYTSADSVFQIACHESVVPIERLYELCRIARELCTAPDNVQRVIARPFEGLPGAFRRTEHRKDFPVSPPHNLIDEVTGVYGIGVVPELFEGRGFRSVPRTQSNAEHAAALTAALESDARFIFANFEDFDMLYGHRNDPSGFAKCLEDFDPVFKSLVDRTGPDDLLLLTADHGNDPTDASTDHSREYVPVCVLGPSATPQNLGDIEGMQAIGATVAKHLSIPWPIGTPLTP